MKAGSALPDAWRPRLLGAILAAAAALRLGYLVELGRTPFFDHLILDLEAYDSWGRRIAAGDWLGSEVFYQDPLYPYFLGALYTLFGHRLLAVYLVQIALGTLVCYLVYALCRRVFSVEAGLIAAALAAVYRPFVFYDVQIEKSFLAVLTITAACLGLVVAVHRRKPARWCAAGLLLGVASLVRGNYLVLLPVTAVALSLLPRDTAIGQRLRAAAWFVAGAAVVLSATALRNYAVARDWVLTTSQAGQNFYIGNNPANTTGMYRAPDWVRPDPKFEQADFAREAERRTGRALTPSEVSRYWFGEARRFILDHPFEFLGTTARRAALAVNDYEIPDNLDLYFFRRYSTVLSFPLLAGFGVVAALAAWGVVSSAGAWRSLWPLHLFCWAYLASVLAFYVFSRYRLPVVPFLLVFAGEGVCRVAAAARARDVHRLAAAAVVVGAAAFVTVYPVIDPYNPPALVNLGAVLMKSGELEPAEAIFREVAARRPDFADAHNNLGVLLLRKGDSAGAIGELRRAVELRPRHANAHINLALALKQQGNAGEARAALARAAELAPGSVEVHAAEAAFRRDAKDLPGAIRSYRAALALEPGSAELHNNLGTALLGSGETEAALVEFRQACRIAPAAEYLFNEAVCLERLGRSAEARDAYRRAIDARPDYAEAYNNLGNLLAESGDRVAAIAAYQAFLRSWRGDSGARRAVEEEIRKLR